MSTRTADAIAPEQDTVLPPGQRDPSGFWLPAGYEDARALVRRRGRRRAGQDGNPRDREDDPSAP